MASEAELASARKNRLAMTIRNSQFLIRNFLWWAFMAMLAVVIVQVNPLLGIGIAIIGGIVFGILLYV